MYSDDTGLPGTTLMREGRAYRVVIAGFTSAAVNAGLEELGRHLRRSTAFFGLFSSPVVPATWDGRRYVATMEGSTWRTSGTEYTVAQLRAAVLEAYRAADPEGPVGLGPGSVEVFGSGALPLDPGIGGARSVAEGAGEVGGAVVDVAVGAGHAASGLGDLAAGAGTGAAAVGSAVGSVPLLAFALTVALVGGAAYLYVKATA